MPGGAYVPGVDRREGVQSTFPPMRRQKQVLNDDREDATSSCFTPSFLQPIGHGNPFPDS